MSTASGREQPQVVQSGVVYRFAKISNGAYFYTGSEAEKDVILQSAPDMRYEGVAFGKASNDGLPVYRFANLVNGGYFFTASESERDYVTRLRPDMRFEGSSFSVPPGNDPSAMPVYRLANTRNGAYLYTASAAERDSAVALGYWRDEGTAFSAYVQRLTLSVQRLSVETYPGESASFSFEAQLNSDLNARVVNIGVFDPSSMTLTPPSQVTTASSGRYVFNLSTATSNALRVGTYTTNLQLRMCTDSVETCRSPVAGSPWTVPLTLTVKSPTNLTPLQAVDGLGAWSTYQGNAGHTGFVPASFSPAAFSRRWQLAASSSYSQSYRSVVIDNGVVFHMRRGANGNWELAAVSEDTGQIAWKVDMGGLYRVNPPAVGNGRVYVTSTGHSDSFMWVFDQANGALINKLTMSSQWGTYSAPTVFGTDVYSIDGYYGGVARFSDLTGRFNWRVGSTIQEGWTPATDGVYAYAYSTPDNRFLAFNAADGSLAYSIGPPYPYSTFFTAAPVVLTDDQLGIVAAGSLMAFDLNNRTRAWVLGSDASGTPAYGNGTVYAFGANGTVLQAYHPRTGMLLWTSQNLGLESFSSVVVTHNLAFVSSSTSTLAIDLATRQIVWKYPKGGSLAISARGVLTIFSGDGTLAAVNLR